MVVFALLCLLPGPAAKAQNRHDFTQIATNSRGYAGYSLASINSSGTVAFSGEPVGEAEGVFTGDGGPLTVVANRVSLPGASFYSVGPAINDTGTVAFQATIGSNGYRICRRSVGAALETIASRQPVIPVLLARSRDR